MTSRNVAGRLVAMETTNTPGGLILAPTQLIQWHNPEPTQWIITLAQLRKDASSLPWSMPVEGGTAIAPTNMPTIPSGSDALMCDVRFGVAGASTRVLFDYPSAGGCFGLTADAIELTVHTRKNPSDTIIATVPQVGAMLVEGVATSSELTWTETALGAVPANETRHWTVKPFAKTLRVSIVGALGGEKFSFVGGPPGSATLWRQVVAAGASVLEIPVPSGAVMVEFINLGNTPSVYAQWVVELS